LKIVFDGT